MGIGVALVLVAVGAVLACAPAVPPRRATYVDDGSSTVRTTRVDEEI